MHLVSTLNAGIAAAANGWAEVYIRGTSTRATVYYDFEASTSDSSGDNIDLDAYGAVEVYVNQLVDVIAKSPDGTVIRSWTDGYASPNIEVISPSFSGNDYVSGAGGVNEPTTLQAVLNRWVTSSGSFDWKVSIGGAATDLDDAFGILTGFLFNVKSPEYGAVGDGVTNDQGAIQAALADAVAAGGGVVFFPLGTYLTSTAIEWDHRVSMVGVGADLSTITSDSASNANVITWTSGSARIAPQLVSGMSFASSLVNSGTQVYSSVAVNVVFERCRFGASATATGIHVDVAGTSSSVAFRDCVFNLNGSIHAVVGTSGATTQITFSRCTFKTTVSSFGAGLYRHDARTKITDCEFDITSVNSGSGNIGVECASGATLHIQNCRFASNVVSFTSCVSLLAGVVATVGGCDFGTNPPYTKAGGILAAGSSLQLSTQTTSSGGSTFTVPNAVETASYILTGTVPTFTMPTFFQRGQKVRLIIANNSGGAWGSNITFTGGTTYGTVDTTAAPGEIVVAEFVVTDSPSGSYAWVGVSVKLGSA